MTARITVPTGFTGDAIHWQVANANGASAPRRLPIAATPDIPEDESLTSTGTQQPLPTLPLTVSGRLRQKEEVDRYSFVAPTSGLVTCRVDSSDFGFGISAAVQIHNENGRTVSDAADTEGKGLQTTFSVIEGEQYFLTLHDIDYRGNRAMTYRLSLSTGPRVIATIPAVGQAGHTQEVLLIGYGVETGGDKLETTSREVTFPESETSFQFTSADKRQLIHHFPLSNHPERTELDGKARSPLMDIPSAVTGRLTNNTKDEYEFNASKGEELIINVHAESIGSVLDVAFEIVNDKEKIVARADDANGSTDASLKFKAPADGVFRIRIFDHSGRVGQPLSIYRLALNRPYETLEISAPQTLAVVIGDESPPIPKRRRVGKEPPGLLYLDVTRPPDCSGEIAVRLTNLPDGVEVPKEISIPAAESSVVIPITANGTSLARRATISCAADGMQPITAQILITPLLKPRAKVRPKFPDAGRTVHRGATYKAPVVVTRVEDYSGEVRLQMAARPDRVSQGIFGDEIVVPPGVSDVEFPIFLPEWVQIDRTSRIVLNTFVNVKDPFGNVRTLVNRMDQRITMNVEGTLLTVATTQKEISAVANKTVEIPVEILRSPKLKRDVIVSVATSYSDEIGSVVVPASESKALLQLDMTSELQSTPESILTLKAVAVEGDELLAMSSTTIVLLSNP